LKINNNYFSNNYLLLFISNNYFYRLCETEKERFVNILPRNQAELHVMLNARRDCGSSHIRVFFPPRTSFRKRTRPPAHPRCLREYPSWEDVSYPVGFRNGGRRLPITPRRTYLRI